MSGREVRARHWEAAILFRTDRAMTQADVFDVLADAIRGRFESIVALGVRPDTPHPHRRP